MSFCHNIYKRTTSFRGAPTGPRKARPDDRLRANYDVQLHIRESRDSGSPLRAVRNDNDDQRGCHGWRFRKKAVRRAPIPAPPPAIGPVADPDGRGSGDFSELYQPDRAQPAARDGAAAAAARGNL